MENKNNEDVKTKKKELREKLNNLRKRLLKIINKNNEALQIISKLENNLDTINSESACADKLDIIEADINNLESCINELENKLRSSVPNNNPSKLPNQSQVTISNNASQKSEKPLVKKKEDKNVRKKKSGGRT